MKTQQGPEQSAAAYILQHCGGLIADETVVILYDSTTRGIVGHFERAGKALGADVRLSEVPVASRHGEEPSPEVSARMLEGDLVAALTKMSLAHTKARKHHASLGRRYLSLPGYSRRLLLDPSVRVDFRGQFALTRAIATRLTEGSVLTFRSERGTQVTFDIRGRTGNCCPGFVNDTCLLGSPPDIEANISPLESGSEGVAMIDGSVTVDGVGLVDAPLRLVIKGGKLVDVSGDNEEHVSTIKAAFASVGDEKAYILAEAGIGLNPAAHLTGNMLTDEGVLGSVHLGFGSNSTVGGVNDVPFHIDFVLTRASVAVDGEVVVKDGVPCIPIN